MEAASVGAVTLELAVWVRSAVEVSLRVGGGFGRQQPAEPPRASAAGASAAPLTQ